jgi:hypothetical protein
MDKLLEVGILCCFAIAFFAMGMPLFGMAWLGGAAAWGFAATETKLPN